jgi:hypothetical protein
MQSTRPKNRMQSDLDEGGEFRWAFQQTRIGGCQRVQSNCDDVRAQRLCCIFDRDRQHARQMVMQRAALVTGVGGIVLMLAVARMNMVVMIMRDATSFGGVRGNILLLGEGMFEMQADERHDTGCLGYKEEP